MFDSEELMETIYSKLDKKYCFLPSVTTYATPKKITKIIYFKYIHKNHKQDIVSKSSKGFGEYYMKMLERAFKLLDYLGTIKNEIRWFYYSNAYTYRFNYINIFRNGEKMRTIRNVKKPYGMPIPTLKQLIASLIPQVFKNYVELSSMFADWKKEHPISIIRSNSYYHNPATNFLKFVMYYKYNECWNLHKERWYSNPKTFQINEFLSLRLEENETNIYINGKLFNQCKFLLFNITNKERTKYKDIDSIDEASELYDKTHETDHSSIGPKTEFFGHCSNLQAWYENDYDTRILHSNLAFPLLKKLKIAGDPLAKKVFKEEIALRLESEYFPILQYLISENYLYNFSPCDLKIISKNLKNTILKTYLKHYFSFMNIGASLSYDPIKRKYNIYIHNELIIEKKNPKIYFSQQRSTDNTLNTQFSLKEIRFSEHDRIYQNSEGKLIHYYFYKKIIVRKDLIDLSYKILGNNSKCSVSIKSNWIEFINVKKKIRIFLFLIKRKMWVKPSLKGD